MNTESLRALDYRPHLPDAARYGIGIVGAGQIVNQAHLPAYRKAGFRVAAITDRNLDAAAAAAQRFGIERVCGSAGELLALPEVEIADLAVPARENPDLAALALASGKHVLVQKPMAESLSEAERMVDAARRANRKLAVNHQMRWSPAVRAAACLLTEHALGELVGISFRVRIRTPWATWPWLCAHPYPELFYHTIHYLDAIRGWAGDPDTVFAALAGFPDSPCAGPTRSYILLEYPGFLRVTVSANHHSAGPDDEFVAGFSLEGTEGRCEGSLGLLLNYPEGGPDVLAFSHRALTGGQTVRAELAGRWFPDAFIGPMSSLMDAIAHDREAETSGEEGLRTMRLLDAVRRSHETRQAIALTDLACAAQPHPA